MSAIVVHQPGALAPRGELIRRIPYARYSQLPGMNISRLKELARSPLNYRFRLENPKVSKALTLGTAGHTAILEPHRFLADYALWDSVTEAGKSSPRTGKNWEAFKAANPGRTIIKPDEFNLAQAMRDQVRGHAPAMRYLRKGDAEVAMLWQDEETGRACRGRMDWLALEADLDVLVGLKTARDCRPIPFGNMAAKLGYHLQWAFYHDGFLAITGRAPKVVEIVVENADAHDVAVYVIPAEVIDQGRNEYRELLVQLDSCEQSGNWPGAAMTEQILSLPSWAYRAEDDLSILGLEAE